MQNTATEELLKKYGMEYIGQGMCRRYGNGQMWFRLGKLMATHKNIYTGVTLFADDTSDILIVKDRKNNGSNEE